MISMKINIIAMINKMFVVLSDGFEENWTLLFNVDTAVDGELVGIEDGLSISIFIGYVGALLGAEVGAAEGVDVGYIDGADVGSMLGKDVG